jgi:hypothetical protein
MSDRIWRLLPDAASDHRRSFDLDLEAEVKRTDRHDRAGWSRIARPVSVDLIEARPMLDIGEIDPNLHQLRDAAASTFQRRREIRL